MLYLFLNSLSFNVKSVQTKLGNAAVVKTNSLATRNGPRQAPAAGDGP